MNIHGKRPASAVADPLVINELDAELVRAKRMCIGKGNDEYCLPLTRAPAPGDVMIAGAGSDVEWTSLVSVANGVRRVVLKDLRTPLALDAGLVKSVRTVTGYNGIWRTMPLPVNLLNSYRRFPLPPGGTEPDVDGRECFGLTTEGAPVTGDVYGDFQMTGNNVSGVSLNVTTVSLNYSGLPPQYGSTLLEEDIDVYIDIECTVGDPTHFGLALDVFVLEPLATQHPLPEPGNKAVQDVFIGATVLGRLEQHGVFRNVLTSTAPPLEYGATSAPEFRYDNVRIKVPQSHVRKQRDGGTGAASQVILQFTGNGENVGAGAAVDSWSPIINRITVSYEASTGSGVGTILEHEFVDHDVILNTGVTNHVDLDTFKDEIESRFVVAGLGTDIKDNGGYTQIGLSQFGGTTIYPAETNIRGALTIGQSSGLPYKLPNARGAAGQVLAAGISTAMQWVDLPTPPTGDGGSLIIDRSDDVTALPVIGQFEKLNTDSGNSAQALNLQGFTTNANKTDLVAVTAGRYLVLASASLYMDGNGSAVQCAVAIFAAGNRVCEVAQKVDDSNDFPQACSTHAVVTLNAGDAVSIQIRNLSTTNGINVTDASLTMTSLV
jgi:hypothetical protein